MRGIRDPRHLLAQGLAHIREEFSVPEGFAPAVQSAAEDAARQVPTQHADWLDHRFATLDPASSTDLDQAFALEPSGSEWLLHYAIADVPWFVQDGDILDVEAWQRGTTSYLPDGKASLYPSVLSEGGASLLPGVDRPAIILSVRIDPEGDARLDGVVRALIRSQAKLAYETVRDEDLPAGFIEVARRIAQAEARRGAARVDPPEQELEPDGQGGFALRFRPFLPSETRNAALSLAANLAVAKAMLEAQTGLFRVMAPPEAAAEAGLRASAAGLGLDWPATVSLSEFEKRLDPAVPAEAAFMMAVRRAGTGASYQAWAPGLKPWHAAIAAPYAHATAPLRRLADRYVLQTVLALAQGLPVPPDVTEALPRLPRVMGRAASRDSRIDRAVIDLAEAVMLERFEGCTFAATVMDMRDGRARLQLADMPVIATADLPHAVPGETLRVTLVRADPDRRELIFTASP